MYDASKEYEIENEILDIKNRLHRPNSYLDVMVIDIFEEFISYLKRQKFGKGNIFDLYIKNEVNKPKDVKNSLTQDAYDARFYNYLNDKIKNQISITKRTNLFRRL